MQWRCPSVKSSETTEGDSQLIRPRYVRKRQCKRVQQKNFLKHNYPIGHIYDELCNLNGCEDCCPGYSRLLNSREIESAQWKKGLRIIVWICLIDSLSNCLVCKIGPLQPTYKNIKGEIKMGFGGYLYIVQKLRTVK